MKAKSNSDNEQPAPVRFGGRFVILKHDHPFVHWDLLLEAEGALRSWRLLAEPRPDLIMTAQPLPDHRLHYLDYEGPVSGGRGTVSRWDRGHHTTLQTSVQTTVNVTSDRLGSGRFVLVAGPDPDRWKCTFEPANDSVEESG